MADIAWGNTGNALLAGTHARYYGQKADLEALDEQRKVEAQPYLEPAMKGDSVAMGKLAYGDPKAAVAVTTALSRMDTNQRAKLKEQADFSAMSANAVLQTPEAERGPVYDHFRAEAARRGYDVSGLPDKYHRGLDSHLRSSRLMALDILKLDEHQKDRDVRLQIHNSPGGGTPPAMEPLNGPAVAPAAGRRSDAAPVGGAAPTSVAAAPVAAPGVPGPIASAPVQMAGMPGAGVPQGDSPQPQADASGTPLPPQPKQQGAIWSTDPSTQGYQMMGHRAKPGAPLLPAEVGGHFVYRNPQTGETVLYKPRAEQPTERSQPPPGYQWGPMGADGRQTMLPIQGGPNDPETQRRERIPPGYRHNPGGNLEFIPGGPADPSVAKRSAPMNNEQARDAGFADRMTNSNGLLGNLDKQGSKFWERLSEKTGMGAGYLQTEEYQTFKQARDDFINAQLRRESGAAINADEYVKADKQYFPQPGDKPAVIEQKALNRKIAVEAMIRGAGPTYQQSPSVGTSAAPPAKAGERPPLESFGR